MNSSNQLFKLTFYSLMIQLIIWVLFIGNAFANESDDIEKYPCKNIDINNTCLCERKCLTHYNYENKTYCKVKDCWTYKYNECLPNGKNFIAPLVLNAIPFTSVLGIGYGVMERWDLFGMQMGITFGPLVLFCCGICGALCCCKKNDNVNEIDDDSSLWTELFGKIYQCCYSILIITFWILSIVWVATPQETLDGNGCYLSGY